MQGEGALAGSQWNEALWRGDPRADTETRNSLVDIGRKEDPEDDTHWTTLMEPRLGTGSGPTAMKTDSAFFTDGETTGVMEGGVKKMGHGTVFGTFS